MEDERFTFGKEERLSGTKRIDALFEKGKSFISYPLRVIYLTHEQSEHSSHKGCSILVSVPKKRIKKATHRNRIKRLIRESYRLNKGLINKESTPNVDIDTKSVDVAFIYVKDTTSDFPDIQKAMQKALNQIASHITKTEKSE